MKKLLRNPAIVWRLEKRREAEIVQALEAGEDVSDKGSVILIDAGTMHQLNLVGGRIWTLCDGERTVDDLIAELANEFEVDRAELADDVEAFVNDLMNRGWLAYG